MERETQEALTEGHTDIQKQQILQPAISASKVPPMDSGNIPAKFSDSATIVDEPSKQIPAKTVS